MVRVVGVVRILDGARRLMEAVDGVQIRVIVFRELRTVTAHSRRLRGGVVDDRVHVNADANACAALHHVCELGGGSTATLGEGIADRLVALPPRKAGEHRVLARRRDLNPRKTRRSEVIFTFGGDVGPLPLEQMHEHTACYGQT